LSPNARVGSTRLGRQGPKLPDFVNEPDFKPHLLVSDEAAVEILVAPIEVNWCTDANSRLIETAKNVLMRIDGRNPDFGDRHTELLDQLRTSAAAG
jgi:hypothetical protein